MFTAQDKHLVKKQGNELKKINRGHPMLDEPHMPIKNFILNIKELIDVGSSHIYLTFSSKASHFLWTYILLSQDVRENLEVKRNFDLSPYGN